MAHNDPYCIEGNGHDKIWNALGLNPGKPVDCYYVEARQNEDTLSATV